jgi:predicted Zn-dependent peptidase
MSVTVTTLNNGLRIATDPMEGVRTASVGVFVNAGARHETVEGHGVAHFLEHMAFKGTERRSARGIAEEIEAVGGHLNAYTAREQTTYYARVLADDVPLGIDLLADIVQHSVFAEGELEKERQVIIQEIGQADDTPDDLVFDLLQETTFPGQTLGRPILGTPESVAGMPRAALCDFIDGHYAPGNVVFSASGAVTHDQLVELVSKAFAALPAGRSHTVEPARFIGGERRELRELEQAHLALAFPCVAFDDPDFYAAQVYATLLGGGMSSRLFQEIRENRGLAYSVFAFTGAYNDGGALSIYAGTSEDDLNEVVPLIAAEMQAVTEKVGEGELARARAQLKAGLLMSLESSTARAEQLGRQLLVHGRPLPTEEIVAAVDAVDEAAIRRVARRVLAGPLGVSAVGPVRRLADHARLAARFRS